MANISNASAGSAGISKPPIIMPKAPPQPKIPQTEVVTPVELAKLAAQVATASAQEGINTIV